MATPSTTRPHRPRPLDAPSVTTASDLRAEVEKLREFADWVADAEVLDEIHLMVAELERRARELGDGDASP